MQTEMIFYDVNADYYAAALVRISQDYLGQLIRVPSVDEIVEIRRQDCDDKSKVKKYKVREISTQIEGDKYRDIDYVCYLIGLEEIEEEEEEKQKEESFEFKGYDIF